MHNFHYQHDMLHCEDVPIDEIVKEYGTPCYIYSHATLVRHYQAVDEAFHSVPHIIAFAMKANSNLAVLRLMGSLGSGADIVSGGELYRALTAGIPSQKIVFAGVGKAVDEIQYALESNILMFNVESSDELHAINEVARTLKCQARVALRINPDIDPQTHPYISTGLKKSKFGIGADRAIDEFGLAASLPHIEIVGVHCHIGSQLTQVTPFVDALKKISTLIHALREKGHTLQYLNIGGGLGITYSNESPPHPKELAEAVSPILQSLNCHIILEPGRVIVGNAGILVSKVLYNKNTDTKRFVIVDAAMNDLLRPSLYEAHHDIWPVQRTAGTSNHTVDVVGPICESGDFLAKDRDMPDSKPGDLLAVMSAGAYAFSMASNYNSRPRVPEILVKGSETFLIRKRESYQDLIQGEQFPEFLQSI